MRKMCAEILLKARADPDAANFDGERPLHYAAKYGHPEVAKVLLEYGAARNLRSRKGQTPLELCEQVAVAKTQSGVSDRFQELLHILKQGNLSEDMLRAAGLDRTLPTRDDDERSTTSMSTTFSQVSPLRAGADRERIAGREHQGVAQGRELL